MRSVNLDKHVKVKVLVTQSCPNSLRPRGHSPSGSSVQGIFQARILEWVAMPSSRKSSWPRDRICAFCAGCIAGGFFNAEPLEKPLPTPTGLLSFSSQGLLQTFSTLLVTALQPSSSHSTNDFTYSFTEKPTKGQSLTHKLCLPLTFSTSFSCP